MVLFIQILPASPTDKGLSITFKENSATRSKRQAEEGISFVKATKFRMFPFLKKLKHLKYFPEEENDIAPVNKNYQDRSPLSDSIIIRCWIHSRHKLLITKSGAARGGSNARRGVPHKCTSTAHLGVKTSSARLFLMARPV